MRCMRPMWLGLIGACAVCAEGYQPAGLSAGEGQATPPASRAIEPAGVAMPAPWAVASPMPSAPSGAHHASGKQEAVRFSTPIPFEAVQGPYRERVLTILNRPILHRRGPAEIFPCYPALFEWLLDHPAWVAEYWRQLGLLVSPVELLKDGYRCREGERSTAQFHVVYSSPEMRIVYCVGETRRPPLPGSLRAEMVVVHRYRFSRQPDGTYLLVQQLEGFVVADGTAVKTIMKLTRSSCEELVDHCLQDLMVYFSVMCRVIQVRPSWSLQALTRVRSSFAANEAADFEALLRQIPVQPARVQVLPPDFPTGNPSRLQTAEQPSRATLRR